jgi:hypothetical protein
LRQFGVGAEIADDDCLVDGCHSAYLA